MRCESRRDTDTCMHILGAVRRARDLSSLLLLCMCCAARGAGCRGRHRLNNKNYTLRAAVREEMREPFLIPSSFCCVRLQFNNNSSSARAKRHQRQTISPAGKHIRALGIDLNVLSASDVGFLSLDCQLSAGAHFMATDLRFYQ